MKCQLVHAYQSKYMHGSRANNQQISNTTSNWHKIIVYSCVEAIYNETNDEYPNEALYPWTVAMTSKT